MDNFKLDIWLIFTYLATMLATLLIGVCIRRLAYRVRLRASRRPKLFRGYFADRKLAFAKLPALALFILFVGEFLWITQLFLTNNIKTNKVVTILRGFLYSNCTNVFVEDFPTKPLFPNIVNRLFQVVDTSQLINSIDDIFLSDRVACFSDQEQEINIIYSKNFPQTHVLSRIFKEKTSFPKEMATERNLLKNDRCLAPRDPSMQVLVNSDLVLFIGSQVLIAFILVVASMFTSNRNIWVSKESLLEYQLVAYHNARHSYNQERYNRMQVLNSFCDLTIVITICSRFL